MTNRYWLPALGLSLWTACTTGSVAMDDDDLSAQQPMAGGPALAVDQEEAPESGELPNAAPSGPSEDKSASAAYEPGDLDIPCEQIDRSRAVQAPDLIFADTTWRGLVVVGAGSGVAEGATLRIEPGTTVIIDGPVEFVFGAGTRANLQARGTAELPVRFCGSADVRGHWRGIRIGNSLDSVLSHVVIDNAGRDGYPALRLDSEALVQDVTIRQAGAAGVRAPAFAEPSARLSVLDSAGPAAVLRSPKAISGFPRGGDFDAIDDPVVLVDFTSISSDTTFSNLGLPYLSREWLKLGNARVVFEAGVEYRFGADADMFVGDPGTRTELLVNGTAEEPVVFSGQEPVTGYWGGIEVHWETRSSSALRHLIIRHAGAGEGYALDLDSPITLDELTVEDSYAGVTISDEGLHRDSGRIFVRNVEDVPLRVDPNALTTLAPGTDVSANEHAYVLVPDVGPVVSTSGVIPALSSPFRVQGTFSVGDASLEIRPGARFEMEADASVEFGWSGSYTQIIARGTSEAPIEFVGTSANPGHWRGIRLGNQVSSDSIFQQVRVADAGQYRASLVVGRSIPVRGCTFEGSASFGLSVPAADAPEYEQMNTFRGNASGAVEAR